MSRVKRRLHKSLTYFIILGGWGTVIRGRFVRVRSLVKKRHQCGPDTNRIRKNTLIFREME